MDHHIKDFFGQDGETTHRCFHHVIVLNDEAMDLKAASALVPNVCKGWCELARLSASDRIEFTRDFWLSKLPYHAGMDQFLNRFFASLDDILILLTQQKFDDPYNAQMVYSLKDDAGFFRGNLPASDQEITDLQNAFAKSLFPTDYIAFLQIHNGFCKTTDATGITRSSLMKENYELFQSLLAQEQEIKTNSGAPVNPLTLIPFYESFGMPFLQCFWAEWYPEDEMGNVYYSSSTKTISDVSGSLSTMSESMAFPTFLDWLMFYMERIS